MSEVLRQAVKAKTELEMTERAFDLLESQFLEEIASSALEQTLLREQLYQSVQVLRKVKLMLLTAAQEVDLENNRLSLAEAGFSV